LVSGVTGSRWFDWNERYSMASPNRTTNATAVAARIAKRPSGALKRARAVAVASSDIDDEITGSPGAEDANLLPPGDGSSIACIGHNGGPPLAVATDHAVDPAEPPDLDETRRPRLPGRRKKPPPSLADVLAELGVASVNEIPPTALLSRMQLSVVLTAIGLPVAVTTLETWASSGVGPSYVKVGKFFVRHRWGENRAWAVGRVSEPHTSAAAHRAPARTRELQPPPPAPATARRRLAEDEIGKE
jgi:hypothetical protein